MSLLNLLMGNYLDFSGFTDLCKQMSTKSNDNAAAAEPAAMEGRRLVI